MTFLPFFRKRGFGGKVIDCVMVSKQSEQDTLRVTQLKIGDICLYMCGHMSCYTLTLPYFRVCSVFDPAPNFF